MGDRGNIVIEKDGDHFESPIFFYTHWTGSDIKETLQSALIKGESRWDDPQYLSRVIFCGLVGNDDGITGYGITTCLCDNEHNLLCVNMKDKTVTERKPNKAADGEMVQKWTFEDYVKVEF